MEGLTSRIDPATLAQGTDYHPLGLREGVLTRPVMVALVLSLIGLKISGVLK